MDADKEFVVLYCLWMYYLSQQFAYIIVYITIILNNTTTLNYARWHIMTYLYGFTNYQFHFKIQRNPTKRSECMSENTPAFGPCTDSRRLAWESRVTLTRVGWVTVTTLAVVDARTRLTLVYFWSNKTRLLSQRPLVTFTSISSRTAEQRKDAKEVEWTNQKWHWASGVNGRAMWRQLNRTEWWKIPADSKRSVWTVCLKGDSLFLYPELASTVICNRISTVLKRGKMGNFWTSKGLALTQPASAFL